MEISPGNLCGHQGTRTLGRGQATTEALEGKDRASCLMNAINQVDGVKVVDTKQSRVSGRGVYDRMVGRHTQGQARIQVSYLVAKHEIRASLTYTNLVQDRNTRSLDFRIELLHSWRHI